ncbi:MAG: ribonuclease HII [Pseudomonadota bacterium]|nr:ribonuclease HII [Pseudomonadota bacterium]
MRDPALQLAFDLAVAPGARRIAGVDEAGRGPLAGPVVVAAVVFAPGRTPINGLADSKQLDAQRREALYERILERALAWHVVAIESEEIDRINILQATLVGMRTAVEGVMHAATELARIDGNILPRGLPCPAEAWIGGDGRDRSIMAASIVAKVTRDRMMVALHGQWPQYGFHQHKGYSTPAHLSALAAHGPCPIHRRSFAPVRVWLERHAQAPATSPHCGPEATTDR